MYSGILERSSHESGRKRTFTSTQVGATAAAEEAHPLAKSIFTSVVDFGGNGFEFSSLGGKDVLVRYFWFCCVGIDVRLTQEWVGGSLEDAEGRMQSAMLV